MEQRQQAVLGGLCVTEVARRYRVTRQNLGDRLTEAFVGVADAELYAAQAAGQEAAQEVAPEGLGLCLTDVGVDDRAAAARVHRVGDHERLGAHAEALDFVRTDAAPVGLGDHRKEGLLALAAQFEEA